MSIYINPQSAVNAIKINPLNEHIVPVHERNRQEFELSPFLLILKEIIILLDRLIVLLTCIISQMEEQLKTFEGWKRDNIVSPPEK